MVYRVRSDFSSKASTQTAIIEKAIKAGALYQPQVAVILIVTRQTDKTDIASQCCEERGAGVVWLDNFVLKFKIQGPSDSNLVDRLARHCRHTGNDFRSWQHGILAIPLPGPRHPTLTIDLAPGKRHHRFYGELSLDLPIQAAGRSRTADAARRSAAGSPKSPAASSAALR